VSTPGESQGQWDPNTQTMPPKPRNGMGTAALVFGVLALLTCWFPVVGFVFGLIALILGIVGRGRVKKLQATNGAAATTGLVLGIVSVIINILATLLVGGFILAFLGVGGGQVADQYARCITNAPNAGTPAQVQQAFQECQNQINQQLPQFGG
jgi:hypothetical protein